MYYHVVLYLARDQVIMDLIKKKINIFSNNQQNFLVELSFDMQ